MYSCRVQRGLQAGSVMQQLNLLQLDESQNLTFDADYHSPGELNLKLQRLRDLARRDDFSILDVGGGNGRFLDTILEVYPSAHGTLIDISPQLTALNRPHPRKTIRIGSVENLGAEFPEGSFDIIMMNWLLHHLVSPSYSECENNCKLTLHACRKLLKPNGTIVVTENMFDGFGGTNLPSWMIYMITRVRAPWFVARSRRFFNTAGVGVCFRSASSWRGIFRDAGLRIVHDDAGRVWDLAPRHRLAAALLGLESVSHRHFFLQPA